MPAASQREFRFKDFYRTMSFVNALAHIANIEDHHPDLEVGYNYCRVRYTTHAIGGLSENDFICAAKIDQLPSIRAPAPRASSVPGAAQARARKRLPQPRAAAAGASASRASAGRRSPA